MILIGAPKTHALCNFNWETREITNRPLHTITHYFYKILDSILDSI